MRITDRIEEIVALLYREVEGSSPAVALTMHDAIDSLLVALDTIVAEGQGVTFEIPT